MVKISVENLRGKNDSAYRELKGKRISFISEATFNSLTGFKKAASRYSRYASTDEQEESISMLEETLAEIGKKIVGATTIGKSPQTVILDLTYQGSEIYVRSDGEVLIHDVSVIPDDAEDVLSAIDGEGE